MKRYIKSEITIDNFSKDNRSREIGNSLYRICQRSNNSWYIVEIYDDGMEFMQARQNYNSLEDAINSINSFTSDGEIVNSTLGRITHDDGSIYYK